MKVMIVDDEPIVPRALTSIVDWKHHGFRLIGTAGDGLEALAIMEQERPDLLLLDCRMPNMDGLELMSIIRERGWHMKIIILSGHDEFVYAQQALSLGALEYVLKPPNMEILLNILLRARSEWVQENHMRQIVKENLPLLRDRYIRSLLEGARHKQSSFEEKTAYLGISLASGPFVIAIAEIEDEEVELRQFGYEDQELMSFAIQNIVEETLDRWRNKWFYWESQKHFIMLINVAEDNIKELHHDLVSAIRNIRSTLKYTLTFAVSPVDCDLWRGANNAYRKSKHALEYKYYIGTGEVIFFEDVYPGRLNERASMLEPFDLIQGEQLRQACELCSLEQMNLWLAVTMSRLKEAGYSVPFVKSICSQALILAAQSIAGLHPYEKREEWLKDADLYHIQIAGTFEEIKNNLQESLNRMLQTSIKMRSNGKHAAIKKVIAYIKENYMKELTLDQIAEEVHLSKAYLSFLFKQSEGQNLTDYIIQLRMEHAKELLSATLMRTYEIAQQVGYQDEKYFGRIFKKRYGITPSEYRNSK